MLTTTYIQARIHTQTHTADKYTLQACHSHTLQTHTAITLQDSPSLLPPHPNYPFSPIL